MGSGSRHLGCVLGLVGALGLGSAGARGEDVTGTAGVSAAETSVDELTGMSLEALMNVEVTSVGRQKQRLTDAPAAVSVISREDIRRSGMSSIPELLRLSPGLDVARINPARYAVSSRGFNDLYANKLLVLMDGRTVYQPLYSGVYWEMQDYVLEDLDRVEVIRGPGATLWGANAVNGVINITSRSARDTQGWLLSGRAGTEEGAGSVRYGGKIDDETFYRVFGKYRALDSGVSADGSEADDDAEMPMGGFRVDRHATDADTYTLEGGLSHTRNGSNLAVPSFAAPFKAPMKDDFKGDAAHLLARWHHVVSDKSDWTLQAYVDWFDVQEEILGYEQDTIDVDFQHRFAAGDRQEIMWGLGYRYLHDEIDSTEFVSFDPSTRADYIASGFVQDRVTIVPERLNLFVGSKFEVNGYTGFEAQPSARALWTPNERNSVWASVSRAVRTPSRFEEDGRVLFERGVNEIAPGIPVLYSAETVGNRRQKSEVLLAYELGYRVQLTRGVSLDVAGFYNNYDRLRSGDLGAPTPAAGPPPHFEVPIVVGNKIDAEFYGVEVAASAEITPEWRVSGSWTFLDASVDMNGANDPFSDKAYGESSPEHQLQVRSYLNVTRDVEFNVLAFYVGGLDRADTPSYVRLDANLVWRPRPGMEWSVGVQNALDDRHPEFGVSLNQTSSETQRMVYTQLVWTF